MNTKDLEYLVNKPVNPRWDTNVRPGDQLGLSAQQVRNFIARSKRAKGIIQSLAVGDSGDIPLQLPGTAKLFLGFAFQQTALASASDLTGELSLTINNDLLINNTHVAFFGSGFTDEEYYFIPYPLSGKDDIKFTINSVLTLYTAHIIVYYI